MQSLLKRIVALLLVIFVFSCNTNDPFKRSRFKYSDGFHIADVIDFTKNTSVRNDTVYLNHQPVAVFESYEKRWLADNLLFVKSLQTGVIGRYVEK